MSRIPFHVVRKALCAQPRLAFSSASQPLPLPLRNLHAFVLRCAPPVFSFLALSVFSPLSLWETSWPPRNRRVAFTGIYAAVHCNCCF